MSAPLSFSTVVTNYNYERYLAEAVASALGQDYPAGRMEVIVVDDGSTDGSREILRRIAGDPRLRIFEQQNAGQAAAFAHGVAHARHDYVCLLDSDDAFRPDKLAVLGARIGALAGRQEIFLCHDLEVRDERRGVPVAGTWFQRLRLAGRPRITVAEAQHVYPFSVPAGQVYARRLLASILEGLPLGDWRRGADNPIAHAALLRTGAVEYASEPLGRYRIHGENRLLEFDELGRLANRPGTQALLLARRPKLLWYLERYLDTLAIGSEERQERIAWLKRLGATLPVSSEFASAPPARLSFIVVCGRDAGSLGRTLEAIALQTHPACEVLVAAADGEAARAALAPFARANPGLRWDVVADATGAERAALAALKLASGQFISLVESGDRLDRDFAERHLYMHHYIGASMVTACDFRLDADGDPAQEGGYGRRKLWPARRHEPAMRRPARGRPSWVFSPRSGNVIRRTAMLEAFADYGLARGLPQDAPLEWLLLHFATALGGCTQFAECLTTLDLETPHPGGMHARDPGDPRFVPRLPQPLAGRFLLGLASERLAEFRGHFGAQLGRFVRWAVEVDAGEAAPTRALAGAELHPEIAALLRERD